MIIYHFHVILLIIYYSRQIYATLEPNDLTVLKNTLVCLPCNYTKTTPSNPAVNFAWSLDDFDSGEKKFVKTNYPPLEKKVSTFPDQQISLDPQNGTLCIDPIKLLDAGIFTCIVFLSTEKNYSAVTYTVFVVFAPEINVPLNNVTVNVNEQHKLRCSAEGNQPITYEYFVNNIKIDDPNGMDFVYYNFTRNSQVKCVTKNVHGVAESIAFITVIGGENQTTIELHKCSDERLPSSCVHFLPTSSHSYYWRSTLQMEINSIDRHLSLLFRNMDRYFTENFLCLDRAKRLICSQTFPPCLSTESNESRELTSGHLSVCREFCQIIQSVCEKDFWKTILSSYVETNFKLLFKTRLEPLFNFTLTNNNNNNSSTCHQFPSIQSTNNSSSAPLQPLSNASCIFVELEPQMEQQSNVCYWPGGSQYYQPPNVTIASYYNGDINRTECIKWSEVDKVHSLYNRRVFPSLGALETFSSQTCRNPGHVKSAPFCFVKKLQQRAAGAGGVGVDNTVDFFELEELSCESVIAPCNQPIDYLNRNNSPRFRLGIVVFLPISLFVIFIGIALFCVIGRIYMNSTSPRKPNTLMSMLLCRCPLDGINFTGVELQGISTAFEGDLSSCTRDEYKLKQGLTNCYSPHKKGVDLHPQLQSIECARNELKEIAQLGKGIFGDVFLVEAPSLPKRQRMTSFYNETSSCSLNSIGAEPLSSTSSRPPGNSNAPSVGTTDDNNAFVYDDNNCINIHSPESIIPSSSSHTNKSHLNNRAAMKVLRDDAESWVLEGFLHEAELLVQFDHPNVIHLLGVCLLEEPYCLLQDYMDYGDLNSFLRRCRDQPPPPPPSSSLSSPPPPPQPQYDDCTNETDRLLVSTSMSTTSPSHLMVIDKQRKLHLALQIAKGMMYISSKGFVHRDLATRNCLLNSSMCVKISDFMLCVSVQPGEDFVSEFTDKAPFRWLSPESLFDRRYNLDTDVWSFGVLLWEIFTMGEQPYTNQSPEEIKQLLMKKECLPQPVNCDEKVYKLMKECWNFERNKRPTFSYLVESLKEISGKKKSIGKAVGTAAIVV